MGTTKTSEKIVHYQIAVSRTFQSNHPKKGEETNFVEKIEIALNLGTWSEMPFTPYFPKLHTIRKNYPMWVKRMKKVTEGKALIELFYWKLPGGRWNLQNEKVVFATLDKDSGCGVQKLEFDLFGLIIKVDNDDSNCRFTNISKNDGLSPFDFKAWFKGYDLSEPMAIIHFTKFRY